MSQNFSKKTLKMYFYKNRFIHESRFNYCLECGFNDEDYGCTCSSFEIFYQCIYAEYAPKNVIDFFDYIRSLSSHKNAKHLYRVHVRNAYYHRKKVKK